VFRPDQNNIGRLVSRKRGKNRSEIRVGFDNHHEIIVDFSNRSTKCVNVSFGKLQDFAHGHIQPVYIPSKEIISATENFASLYEEYNIALDETYYDLARLLNKPLKKGDQSPAQNWILNKFETITEAKVVRRDKKFFLNVRNCGELEMGLVSEGYRKLSTILYLLSSGSLEKDSILFWDEPESDMSPKLVQSIAEAIIELSKTGIQIFLLIHSHFLQQVFEDLSGTAIQFNSLLLQRQEIETHFPQVPVQNPRITEQKKASV